MNPEEPHLSKEQAARLLHNEWEAGLEPRLVGLAHIVLTDAHKQWSLNAGIAFATLAFVATGVYTRAARKPWSLLRAFTISSAGGGMGVVPGIVLKKRVNQEYKSNMERNAIFRDAVANVRRRAREESGDVGFSVDEHDLLNITSDSESDAIASPVEEQNTVDSDGAAKSSHDHRWGEIRAAHARQNIAKHTTWDSIRKNNKQ